MAEDEAAAGPARRDRLARRRKAIGLTQQDLAGLLGVGRSTVVRWERGETEPLPWLRPKLARALRVPPGRLADLLTATPAGPDTTPEPGSPAPPPATPAPGQGRAAAPAAVPRQLPATVADFTGRAAEIETLTRIVDGAGAGPPGTVVISAIGGTAGVGKTALALHWAHRVASRFAGGQLYVNLRGFDPAGTPASPAEAIRGFLDALGVPPDKIPPAPDAQAAMYRGLAADRKLLIVLDNARDEEQVRPLLAASAGSLVVVTSRNQLTGLAAADGARLLTLDVLTHSEATELLAARIGAGRASAEPGAVSEIATRCARLPLALAVAAARTAARPAFPLVTLAAELRDSAGRLDALDAGDPAASVRAVFSWSYEQLSTEAARMFRLLGLHPGPDITAPAAASLGAVSQPAALRLLRELTRSCLLTEHVPGRYSCHDLLRAYAAAQARGHDSEAEREAAVGRVLDHYLHTAGPASLLLNPSHEPVALTPPRPGTAPEQSAGYQQALAWFEAEHHVLISAVALAGSSGFDNCAWQLPWAMMPFLARRGRGREWAATQRTALAAASRLGDAPAQVVSARLLAIACFDLGDYDEAFRHFGSSLGLYRQLGNRFGEAKVHQNLAVLAETQGRYADSLDHNEQALRLYVAVGHKAGQAEALNGVGWCHGLLGDYERAGTFCRRALALCSEVGYRRLEGDVWDSIGYAEHHRGNFAEATACYQRALGIFREFGDRSREAATLVNLGDTRHAAGELPAAREAWRLALAIHTDIGHPDAEKVRAKLTGLDGPAS